MKKRLNLRKAKLNIVVIVLLVVSGIGAVYSWIIGDITPEVRGEFSIGSATGLVFSLGSTEGVIADLNEYYGLSSTDLQLSECSSVNGTTIYARDYSQYFEDTNEDEIVVLKTASKLVLSNGEMVGDYLEETFTLRLTYSDDDDFYIYFLNGYLDGTPYWTSFKSGTNSTITTDGLKALRVAMYVDGLKDGNGVYQSDCYDSALFDSVNSTPKYAIFCNDYEQNPEAVQAVGSIKLPLSTRKTSYNICQNVGGTMYGTVGTPSLLKFSDYSLNNGTNNVSLIGSAVPTGTNWLFKLSQSYSSVNITIRIWLEGLSDYCTDGKISSDDAVDLNLYFVAYHTM